LEAAVAVSRNLEDRRAEGESLNYLGALHAKQADFDAARRCMDASEQLLRDLDQVALAVLLCDRAEMEQLAGNRDVARSALTEAETIAGATGAGTASELGLKLTHVRDLLDWQSTI
jgi:hypothetical protein